MSPRLYLRADVHLKVLHDDRTPFGSPVGERPEALVRELFAPIYAHVASHGFADLVRECPRLLAEVRASPAFAAWAEPTATAWRLRDEVLYPDPALARPCRLFFVRDDTGRMVDVRVPYTLWPGLHAVIAALVGPGLAPATPLTPHLAAIVAELRAQDLVDDEPPGTVDPRLAAADLLQLGHNTTLLQSRRARVLVDPLLFARSQQFPADYQPHQLAQLGPLDAVLITHSHPDHLDPATLLRLPPSTTIVVPRCGRETILCLDMALRLRELGFDDVRELGWGERLQVGDIEVHALPFYGEQPSETVQLHPEIRNHGNTYYVRTPEFAAVFLADAARDARGDSLSVADAARERLGAPDVVFAGYRAWLSYPVQLLFSSVARYVLFIPPALWSMRQQLMTSIDGSVDIAERWGARYLVPYADGGAPWHWNLALGPRLDDEGAEIFGFDPFPERVVLAARHRVQTVVGGTMASPVTALLLRPGEALAGLAAATERVRLDGHHWPYGDRIDTL